MELGNQTLVTEFILEGLPNTRELPSLFFLIFLLIYLLTLLGNTLTVLTVFYNPQLHNLPMYCFLGHLSVLDACLSSVTVPKIMAGLLGPEGRAISFHSCVVQLYTFHFLGSTECFVYTVMAYDRFLAICHPLYYSTMMSRRICLGLAAGTWLTGSVHAAIHTTLTFRVPYCGPNLVEYFFCDIPPVLKLACADTAANQVTILANIGVVAVVCFLLICISYAYIVAAILKIRTSEGKRQAFSTCSAHLILVLLCYGPPVFIYLHPFSSKASDGAVALFFTALTPLLNPFIYTLKNKEMIKAIRKLPCGQGLCWHA
ncbi:olfactory receptor 10S1-like [Carettochelys insculpta]|uniref:olfactory receptor 10S1-like n=1 Tax=Carettochelys insculpta TaxID=44489 RepID=UPI003EBA0434